MTCLRLSHPKQLPKNPKRFDRKGETSFDSPNLITERAATLGTPGLLPVPKDSNPRRQTRSVSRRLSITRKADEKGVGPKVLCIGYILPSMAANGVVTGFGFVFLVSRPKDIFLSKNSMIFVVARL